MTDRGEDAPASPRRLPPDLADSLVILATCAGGYLLTLEFDPVPEFMRQGLSPERFPQIVIGVIGAFALMMAFAGRAGRTEAKPRLRLRIATTLLLVGAYVATAESLGMFTLMPLYCALFPALWGERHWPLIAAYAGLLPVLLFALFVVLLGTPLPLGLLEGLGG